MREILFRGKGIDNNWYYGVPLVFTEDYVCVTAPHTYNKKVEANTIGQFTGLTDKNGKKIFEGDIIKSCEYDDVYFVKYCADDNYPAFDVVPEINIECNGLSHLHIVEGIEVIGNIHDNPELLSGGNNGTE